MYSRIPYSINLPKKTITSSDSLSSGQPALNDLTNVDTNEAKMGDGDVLMYNLVENLWQSGIIPSSSETVNTLTGLNFNNVATNNLIKKVDANNAGNSNIISSYTATGSVTTLITGDPNGMITAIGGEIITSIIGQESKLEITTGVGAGKRSLILQENQPVIIEDDLFVTGGMTAISSSLISLSVINKIDANDISASGVIQGNTVESIGTLNVGGLINLNGTTGTAGAVLTSNGSSDPTWNPAPIPYYIEIDIGDNGTADIYSFTPGASNAINTLYTTPTAISNYDSDLINNSFWRPSVSGIFFINFNAILRSINQDYLVEAQIHIKKNVGGVYEKLLISGNRNWGSSVDEADARVWSMGLNCPHTFYANAGDKFKFSVYGRSYNNNAIWLITTNYSSNIRITKLA